MDKIKVGIIGAGKISDIHLKTFSENRHVSILMISDLDTNLATEKANRYGIKKVEKDYIKVIKNSEVDVIDILLPHYLHAKVAIKAANHNKIVICEKPLATKFVDVKKIIKVFGKNSIPLYLKHYLHYSSSHIKAKELIHGGTIGVPYLVQCLYTCNSIKSMHDKNSWKGNLKEAGGGVLIDAGVHIIDFLQDIFGNPKSVICECKQISTKLKIKGEDLATMNIEFPNNVMANITCTSNDNSYGFRWEKHIFGSEGSLHIIDYGKNKNELTLYKDGNIVMKKIENDWWNQANKNNINDIVSRIISKKNPSVDLQVACAGIETILKAYKSSKRGRKLNL